jgi:quercetin dioxygenase-like cupin family protein
MNRMTALICVGMLLGSTRAFAQAAVPVEQEPHHHLVFENATLRILEPAIDPGDTTLEHLHRLDYASVCISGAENRSQVSGGEWSAAGRPCVAGTASVSEHVGRVMAHRVQNVGATPFRLVLVENRLESGWSQSAPLSVPFTSQLRESRAFRVYQVDLQAGGDEARHTHVRPTVLILIAGELLVGRDGQKEVLDQPGRWSLTVAGETHALSAGRSGKAVAVEIEVR